MTMDRNSVRPLNAMLHPAWLVGLALLVFNDHFLKASELWPAMSGKLSDFAGLLVAPVLLAAVLQVRTKRGLWLSAVAVGAVFGAINVSPAAAAAWDTMVSGLVPYRTTVDPTDLIALVMLPVGVRLFTPLMQAELARSRVRRTAQAVMAIFGVMMCTATSMDESCTTDSDCPFSGDVCVDEWCEAPPEPTNDANTGSNSSMSTMMVDELEAESLDETTLYELETQPLQSLDPIVIEYLNDDAMPIAH